MSSSCCKSTCLNLSGAMPVGGELTLHRSSRDVLPYRTTLSMSTYMGDYTSPALGPGFLGHIPTISKGSMKACFGAPTTKYFKNCRHDLAKRIIGEKFIHGRIPSSTSPWPDVTHAERVIGLKQPSDQPITRPTATDRARSCELTKLYQNAQSHRDYYLDRSNTIYPVDVFNLGRPYPVRCPIDERVFKIRTYLDKCNEPSAIGPPLNCRGLPCIKAQGFLDEFQNIPKLPRVPFKCGRIKSKPLDQYEVLLI